MGITARIGREITKVLIPLQAPDTSSKTLFQAHFADRCAVLSRAADRYGVSGLLMPAGDLVYPHGDDIPYSFRVSPYFRTLLPGFERPGSYLVFDGGDKPTLYLPAVEDFWHAAPASIDEDYGESVTMVTVTDPLRYATRQLRDSRWTVLGHEDGTASGSESVSSDIRAAIGDFVDFHRGFKTAYEVELIRRANRRAIKGHVAAAEAFRGRCSEFEIRAAYLSALEDRESDQPYNAIVALNEHGAVLHYEQCDRPGPREHRSFLIDAGAACGGYVADITRTYAFDDGPFDELCRALDKQQRGLIDEIALGKSYADLHGAMHERIAAVLQAIGIINCSAEAALEQGITQLFFPHGLGHFIGAQVHDVGGDLRDEDGGRLPKDPRYPFLRLWRPIEAGQVFTIEPGIYFIELLLEPKRSSKEINWSRVDELAPFGGVRIEDNIVIASDGRVENLTRDAFRASPRP